MNRNEEYYALLGELSAAEAPSASLKKAVRRNRTNKFIVRPLAAVAAVLAAFTVIVNASTTAAFAMSKVPGLKELAKAVTFSRSLKDAVEHEYAQLVDLSGSENGISASVEYLIADKSRVTVFYRLKSSEYSDLGADCRFFTKDGKASGSSYGPNDVTHLSSEDRAVMPENGELRSVYVEYFEGAVPSELTMDLILWDHSAGSYLGEQNRLAKLSFELSFDPAYYSSGKHYELGSAVRLGERSITVKSADVYPSQTVLNVEGAGSNDAWLVGLDFELKTSDGRVFGRSSSGTIAYSSGASNPEITSYTADSMYFHDVSSVTLSVRSARWLEKGMEKLRIDLESASCGPLPQGCELAGCTLQKNQDGSSTWILTFLERDELMQLLMPSAADASGNECCKSLSWTPKQSRFNDKTAPEGFSYTSYYLTDCTENVIYMDMCTTQVWNAGDAPAEVLLKLN